MVLGPTQKEILDLVCEKEDEGITVQEMQEIIRNRNLRLPTSCSSLNKTLKELRDKKGLIWSELVKENRAWRNRYFSKEVTKE